MNFVLLLIVILIVLVAFVYRKEILKIFGGNDEFLEIVYKNQSVDGQKYMKEIQGMDLPEGNTNDGDVLLHVPGVVTVKENVADATFKCPEMHNIGAGVSIKCLHDDKLLYYGCNSCLSNKMGKKAHPVNLAKKLLALHYPIHHGDFDWETPFYEEAKKQGYKFK